MRNTIVHWSRLTCSVTLAATLAAAPRPASAREEIPAFQPSADRLFQITAPAVRAPLPIGGMGYDHCGFTPEQIQTEWRTLRSWAETGRRPQLADD